MKENRLSCFHAKLFGQGKDSPNLSVVLEERLLKLEGLWRDPSPPSSPASEIVLAVTEPELETGIKDLERLLREDSDTGDVIVKGKQRQSPSARPFIQCLSQLEPPEIPRKATSAQEKIATFFKPFKRKRSLASPKKANMEKDKYLKTVSDSNFSENEEKQSNSVSTSSRLASQSKDSLKKQNPNFFDVKEENMAKAALLLASSQEEEAIPISKTAPLCQPSFFAVKAENLARAAALFASSNESSPKKEKSLKIVRASEVRVNPKEKEFVAKNRKPKNRNLEKQSLNIESVAKIVNFLKCSKSSFESRKPVLSKVFNPNPKPPTLRTLKLFTRLFGLYGQAAPERQWLIHHYRQVSIKAEIKGLSLSRSAIEQFLYRYWRESIRQESSVLCRALRGDGDVSQPMILRVNTLSVLAECLAEIELSDGWYSVWVRASKGGDRRAAAFWALFLRGAFQPGKHLWIGGAVWAGTPQNGNLFEKRFIELSVNGVKPTNRFRLGVCRSKLAVRLRDIVADGGCVPIVWATVIGKSPVFVKNCEGQRSDYVQIDSELRLEALIEEGKITKENMQFCFSFRCEIGESKSDTRETQRTFIFFSSVGFGVFAQLSIGDQLLCKNIFAASSEESEVRCLTENIFVSRIIALYPRKRVTRFEVISVEKTNLAHFRANSFIDRLLPLNAILNALPTAARGTLLTLSGFVIAFNAGERAVIVYVSLNLFLVIRARGNQSFDWKGLRKGERLLFVDLSIEHCRAAKEEFGRLLIVECALQRLAFYHNSANVPRALSAFWLLGLNDGGEVYKSDERALKAVKAIYRL